MANELAAKWPNLPIKVQWHPPLTGRIAERVNVSTFYNGMNIVTALRTCKAKAMILHDFDLYPLRADYFERLGSRILDDGLRFAGLERTRYDSLVEEDEIYGTWGLAMDAQWLRNEKKPRDIFHRFARLPDGRKTMLDPFSWLQLNEPKRGDAEDLSPEDVCHVKNLCSTYLRTMDGKAPKVAWRIHYLIYLESVSCQREEILEKSTREMNDSQSTQIQYNGMTVECNGTDWTCANVLERELTLMDESLFGSVRPITLDYMQASRGFFKRCSGVWVGDL
ncbi:MAG: hypothetical protein ACX94C_12980 [Phycisphaerales bacterium]